MAFAKENEVAQNHPGKASWPSSKWPLNVLFMSNDPALKEPPIHQAWKGHHHQSRSWKPISPSTQRPWTILFFSAGSIWFCRGRSGSLWLLGLFHDFPVIKPWEFGNRNASKWLELQVSFVFFRSLLVDSALLPMAQNRNELALLGGTFLFGLGALEVCLRFGGYWFT